MGKSELILRRNHGKRKATITKSSVKNEREISIITHYISQRCTEKISSFVIRVRHPEKNMGSWWVGRLTRRQEQYFRAKGLFICQILPASAITIKYRLTLFSMGRTRGTEPPATEPDKKSKGPGTGEERETRRPPPHRPRVGVCGGLGGGCLGSGVSVCLSVCLSA